ncbi:hypothetical protein TVAG_276000 [Trichomonas vaginalis G3]|uniref:Transcription initiation factor TFIID subunit 8 n=1 Tax=Trichomonas vaginalis (strain ATCC PRA-98 / G3) TaxID=412133 RepID=A2EYH3_TRIV3|nr:transcription initiation factor TFIID subunit 8 family [Trichomonas vaginalis G3]EAY02326.1 hypothetical protein TVAG_276000 [Trichomonas vaginalis G3]KAI5500907.1 transcription initiation factor TFIID subunit 8 family [Trichomonas vaginalis G3]|eukprot:XP_001314641.1 hypothetical protein [Trichomonas vaginalis G3]
MSEASILILNDVIVDFIREICKFSSKMSILSGRTEVNAYDLFFALERVANENTNSLNTFIIQHENSISSTLYAPNFPQPKLSEYYKQQIEDNPGEIHFARRFPIIQSQSPEFPFIPSFYPKIPSLKTTPDAESVLQTEKTKDYEKDKRKSREQKILQSELDGMDKDSQLIAPQFVNFNFAKLLGSDTSTNPEQNRISSDILNGIKPIIEPEKEFLFEPYKPKEDLDS